MAKYETAFPLTASTTVDYGDIATIETSTWDQNRTHGCICDSYKWAVGLDSGEHQLAEYFGPDCSLRRCPSGDSDAPARADMGTEIDSSEFHDSPVVLAAKVDRLAAMVLRAERMVVYSGAGLSTAAGIGDYASKARHSRAHTWDPHNGPHIEYLKERAPACCISL